LVFLVHVRALWAGRSSIGHSAQFPVLMQSLRTGNRTYAEKFTKPEHGTRKGNVKGAVVRKEREDKEKNLL